MKGQKSSQHILCYILFEEKVLKQVMEKYSFVSFVQHERLPEQVGF